MSIVEHWRKKKWKRKIVSHIDCFYQFFFLHIFISFAKRFYSHSIVVRVRINIIYVMYRKANILFFLFSSRLRLLKSTVSWIECNKMLFLAFFILISFATHIFLVFLFKHYYFLILSSCCLVRYAFIIDHQNSHYR